MINLFVRSFIAFLCLPLVLPMSYSFVSAQSQSERLPVAYTVIAPTQATLWTAKELGFFAKNGLDV
jgi:ABC-type nitrate/sulfonate/bicarbonate transport system substrate-binding protein